MLNELAREIQQNATDHGWYDIERPIPELLCLIHSEISEALECYRNGMEPNETVLVWPVDQAFGDGPTPEGLPIELADVIMRTLSMCAALGIDIDAAIETKMQYNRRRPHRHGGKKI